MRWNHIRQASFLVAVTLLLAALAAWGKAELQLGWVASNQPFHSSLRPSFCSFSTGY